MYLNKIKNYMGKFYSREEIEFLKKNAEKFGAKICSEKINRPLQGTISKINRLGLKNTNNPKVTKEEIDSLVFVSKFKSLTIDFNETNNPKQLAYFLGFLWANGYVHNNELKIEITEEDGIDIEHIFTNLASFSIYKRIRNKRKPQMTFYYRDAKIYNQLKSLGKYPNSIESHEKILNYIPKKYHIWFLRGLIDGDGCFYIHDYGDTISRQFSITGSINFNWDFLKNLLKSYNLNCTINLSKSEHSNSSRIRCTDSNSIKNFIKILYKDLDGIYLTRKYNKAISM